MQREQQNFNLLLPEVQGFDELELCLDEDEVIGAATPGATYRHSECRQENIEEAWTQRTTADFGTSRDLPSLYRAVGTQTAIRPGALKVAQQLARAVWWEKPTLFGHRITSVPVLFRALDRDGNDRLSRRELASGLRQLGIQGTAAEINAFLGSLDPAGSGRVALATLQAALPLEWQARPSEQQRRALEDLHRHHADFQERMDLEREIEVNQHGIGTYGHSRFATVEDMERVCERVYGRALRVREFERQRRMLDREQDLAQLAPFTPNLTPQSTPRSGRSPYGSGDERPTAEQQTNWVRKQEWLKAFKESRLERERKEQKADERRAIMDSSVHRSVTEQARERKCEWLYILAQRRRERRAHMQQRFEQAELEGLKKHSVHPREATSPDQVDKVVKRLCYDEPEARRARAEARLRARLQEEQLRLEELQLALVDRQALEQKTWSSEDMRRLVERMHSGKLRKVRWRPGYPPASRQELVGAVFHLLAGHEPTVGWQQLGQLVSVCGFNGNLGDWEVEYAYLCAEYGWDPARGIDKDQISDLLGDEWGSTYCNNDMLRMILLDLGARQELVMALFRALSGGGRSLLREQHVRRYAELCGFEGGDAEWAREFRAVCMDYGWSTNGAVDTRQFARLVNDEEGIGYRGDAELHEMLVALKYRPKLVSALFRLIAEPQSHHLGVCELHHFARLCGFDGDDESWLEEYLALVAAYGFDPAAGADITYFLRMLGDAHGSAYRTDAELHALLLEASTKADVVPPSIVSRNNYRRPSWATGGRRAVMQER